ncbi:MAG TPA: hypothetical protein VJJ80_01400 [Patescibacteria group bacterium]|nr:hypothetical protein [Patescibacteria group bacterium]
MNFADKIKITVFILVLFGFFEALYFKQQFFWAILIPISIGFILAIFWILGPDLIRRKRLKMKKLILPLLLIFGVVFFLFFEASGLLRQIVIFLGIIANLLFFINYKKIPLERPKDPKNILVFNFLFFVLNLAAFLDFWVIYSIYFNFGLALWFSMVLILIISLGLFYYLFWATNVFSDFILPFVSLLGLVMLEVFVVLSFWPASFATQSIILILVFYTFSGLLLLKAKKELKNRDIAEFIIIFIIIFALILATLKWYTVF